MLTYIVLFCLVSVSVTKSPARPQISETFVSWLVGTVSIYTDEKLYDFFAYYAADDKEKRTVANTSSTLYGNTSFSTNLNLYDKDTFYAIQWDDNMKSGSCRRPKPIQPTSQRLWDWVKNASYTGRYEFMNIHTWTFQDDDYTQIVGVSVLDSNRPIITLLDGMIKQTIFYIDFKDTPPPKGSFDVPSICSKDDTRMESPPVHTSIFNSFPSQKWIKNTITGNYEDSIHPMVHKMLDKVMQH